MTTPTREEIETAIGAKLETIHFALSTHFRKEGEAALTEARSRYEQATRGQTDGQRLAMIDMGDHFTTKARAYFTLAQQHLNLPRSTSAEDTA